MALPLQPPRYARWADMLAPIKKNDKGWPAYALQCALRVAGRDINPDGAFGPKTHRALKGFQENNGLIVDGVAGPATQQSLLRKAEKVVHETMPLLPDGVLRGFAIVEGAGILAATNWFTPAGGKPGVDCGPVQWRQYGPPFDIADLAAAFDPEIAFRHAGNVLLERMRLYKHRRPSLSVDMVLRVALYAHNHPAGADQIVRNGRFNNPDQLATWTTKPGGGHYTWQQWFEEYTGRILAYVKDT